MSLLDDARRLVEIDPYYDWADGAPGPEMVCIACEQYRKHGHAPDCPWLAMPRIVGALEAAERAVRKTPYNGSTNYGATVCGFCNEEVGMFWREDGAHHEPGCPWADLVEALGDVQLEE